jgi:hypothetical protein
MLVVGLKLYGVVITNGLGREGSAVFSQPSFQHQATADSSLRS